MANVKKDLRNVPTREQLTHAREASGAKDTGKESGKDAGGGASLDVFHIATPAPVAAWLKNHPQSDDSETEPTAGEANPGAAASGLERAAGAVNRHTAGDFSNDTGQGQSDPADSPFGRTDFRSGFARLGASVGSEFTTGFDDPDDSSDGDSSTPGGVGTGGPGGMFGNQGGNPFGSGDEGIGGLGDGLPGADLGQAAAGIGGLRNVGDLGLETLAAAFDDQDHTGGTPSVEAGGGAAAGLSPWEATVTTVVDGAPVAGTGEAVAGGTLATETVAGVEGAELAVAADGLEAAGVIGRGFVVVEALAPVAAVGAALVGGLIVGHAIDEATGIGEMIVDAAIELTEGEDEEEEGDEEINTNVNEEDDDEEDEDEEGEEGEDDEEEDEDDENKDEKEDEDEEEDDEEEEDEDEDGQSTEPEDGQSTEPEDEQSTEPVASSGMGPDGDPDSETRPRPTQEQFAAYLRDLSAQGRNPLNTSGNESQPTQDAEPVGAGSGTFVSGRATSQFLFGQPNQEAAAVSGHGPLAIVVNSGNMDPSQEDDNSSQGNGGMYDEAPADALNGGSPTLGIGAVQHNDSDDDDEEEDDA